MKVSLGGTPEIAFESFQARKKYRRGPILWLNGTRKNGFVEIFNVTQWTRSHDCAALSKPAVRCFPTSGEMYMHMRQNLAKLKIILSFRWFCLAFRISRDDLQRLYVQFNYYWFYVSFLCTYVRSRTVYAAYGNVKFISNRYISLVYRYSLCILYKRTIVFNGITQMWINKNIIM